MRWKSLFVGTLCSLLSAADGSCADGFAERAEVTAEVTPRSARPGEIVVWKMTMKIHDGYHSYPLEQPPGTDKEYKTAVSSISAPGFGPFVFVGAPSGPHGPTEKIDGTDVECIEQFGEWEWRFIVHPNAKPGKYKIELRGNLPVCAGNNCTTGVPPVAEIEILKDPPVPVSSEFKAQVDSFPLEPPTKLPKAVANPGGEVGAPADRANVGSKQHHVASPAESFEQHAANLKDIEGQLEKFVKPTSRGSGGLMGFLLAAVFWGAVALVTPCVFPMIPITVSFFLHQSEHEHHRPIRMALIYCGTIILVLGIAAMTLLTLFRALSINPIMNIALGGLFVFFALSLFGLYEITLPSRLTAFTSSREGGGGAVGTVFMALTFTIVSFTCVAPFLGGFGGMAASGEFTKAELALGALAFSTTFAAPFFLLALFPSMIKKLPQSGSWLNSVKVVMGFMELAACLKFFRTAELRLLPHTSYFTYDFVLGIWVALAVLAALYLLNVFRLHHDEPIEHIGVVRMLFGLAFLSLAVYFLPAIFKNGNGESQRPAGVVYAWVDSFLLPEPGEEDLPWSANLKGTIDDARRELASSGKREFILLDCTGVTCTNCKYNERTVFTRPDVHELLLKFRLVQSYTDTVPESFYPQGADADRRFDEAKANLKFQRDNFGTEQLPLYAVMEVTKDHVIVRGVYDEAKINEPTAFIKFLNDSRAADKN
jgi:thiol:disulfide interchange protein